jgi:hypothetical protein
MRRPPLPSPTSMNAGSGSLADGWVIYPSSPVRRPLFDAGRRARQRTALRVALRLAERCHGLYVGKAEHFPPAGVVRRDQNVSHLIVFRPKDASLLAP